MSDADYTSRLKEINNLASALEGHSSELQEAAALDAGFPVKITSVEVQLAVDYLVNPTVPLRRFSPTMLPA